MKKKKLIFAWATWYPNDENPANGIFIQKHLFLIAKFANVHVLYIGSKNKGLIKRHFEQYVELSTARYYIRKNKLLLLIGHTLIPLIESLLLIIKYKKKIDVIHINCSYPSSLFTFILEILFINKWILSEHWSGYNIIDNRYHILHPVIKTLLRSRMQRYDVITVVSSALKRDLQDNFKVNPIVIPNVIQTPASSAVIRSKATSNCFLFCTITNLDEEIKNNKGLIIAFGEAMKKTNNIKLNIYGPGNQNVYKQLIAELRINEESIAFHGAFPNSQLPQIYQNHHVFLLFSNYETFSVATAEALAFGLPVVVTRSGGPEEFVNEENGYLVNTNSINEMADKICLIKSNYDKFNSNEISLNIIKKYSNDLIIDKFKKIIYE